MLPGCNHDLNVIFTQNKDPIAQTQLPFTPNQ